MSGDARQRRAERAEAALALRSQWSFDFYGWVFERALRSDFHAVRLSRAEAPPAPETPKLVIYSNHPSWWDAVLYVFIVRHFFPRRTFRAPIDAAMLARYTFMGRIGTFGIEQGTRRGAADFMAICRALLADRRNLLMITAQGRFADSRERPLGMESGIAHLVDIDRETVFVPLAIDYCFWMERQPEALLRFGQPLAAATLHGLTIAERRGALETALEATMSGLAHEAIGRDEAAFETLLDGKKGVHPFYDLWRRGAALVKGQRFRPEHGAQS